MRIKVRYGLNSRIYAWAFTKMLKEYCYNNHLEINLEKICKFIKKEYKDMVLRTPGIGGNSNENNLIGACYFFAVAKVFPHMTPDLMDDIIYQSITSDFMVKLHRRKKKKATVFSKKVQRKKLEEAEKSHRSIYEMDWEFTYQPGKDEFYITYTKCGICKLAEREHMEIFLPCLCKMDFPKYELIGGKLIRTKTLALGDDCCNFHVIKK